MSSDLTFEKLYKHCAEVERQNAELQKQVDELNFDKNLLQKLLEKREKDTAKEILQTIMYIIKKSNGFLAEEVIRIMAKQKGVEVDE